MSMSGDPLMPSIARQIVEELFKQQGKWKRKELAKEVERIHKNRGGLPGAQNPTQNVKKALRDLHSDGKVVKGVFATWVWRDGTNEVLLTDSTVTDNVLVDEEESDDQDDVGGLVVVREIGEGREEVYLYFNPNDRKLAEYEKRDVWECKIGKAGVSDSRYRIIEQGAKTALSRQPEIGLVIKTNDSAALERALHASLRLIDARVADSPGVEWFLTSPARVEEWYEHFRQSISRLNGYKPSVDEAVSDGSGQDAITKRATTN